MNKNLKFKIKNSQTGFTLMEVLIASLIFVVVITVATGVFVINSTVADKSRSIRELSQSARYAFESIARDVRNSQEVLVSTSGDSLIITPKTSEDGYTEIDYTYDGNQLLVNGTPLFSDKIKVKKFRVENLGDADYPLVQISLELEYSLGETEKKAETYSQIYRTTVSNRIYPQEDFGAKTTE